MKKSMTSGNALKLILSFSIPLLLGNLFQQFYNMMDAAIVGQTLGSKALASVGATSSVQFLVLGFCIGICQGFAIPLATRFGAGDEKDMRRYEFGGAVWTAIMGVMITVAAVLLCPKILHLLQVNDEIYDNAYWYLVIIFGGIPFTLLYNYLSAILRAIGDSKTPFYFLAFSAVLNIGLDFFCILVLHWGCAGAAIATIASQAVSGVLCLILIARRFVLLHLDKSDMVLDGSHTKMLLGMGLPMGLQFSITAIGSMVMQSGNNSLGTVYVSGFTAGLRIKQLMMCPFDALGSAVSTFVSQNNGAHQLDRIHEGFRDGLLTAVIYGLFACVILVFFGRTMSMLFVSAKEAAVLDASAKYLRRMGYFYPMLGILITSRMAVQGLGFSSLAMFSGLVEMTARSVVTLGFVSKFGYDAITWADQTAWTTASLFLIPLSIYCLKVTDRKIKESQALSQLQ
ncbi:MAG: MATE family efflux transporter [Lactimicrobium sp.]|jgi:putative MATE family efflux protein|uniref:MATE family efflux transporter n=1 Tax=Lactimicrobium sp. TaxID=2563780 RepID=UPI002F35D318